MERHSLFTARLQSVVRPGLGRGQQAARQSLSDHQGDTVCPTGNPKSATIHCSPVIGVSAFSAPKQPLLFVFPQSPNWTFFLAEIFIFPDL